MITRGMRKQKKRHVLPATPRSAQNSANSDQPVFMYIARTDQLKEHMLVRVLSVHNCHFKLINLLIPSIFVTVLDHQYIYNCFKPIYS